MDVVTFRRKCDELWKTAIKVRVCESHDLDSITRWFADRGYSGRGIIPDPLSVWVGRENQTWESPLEVAFHESRGQDAMLFKLTFG